MTKTYVDRGYRSTDLPRSTSEVSSANSAVVDEAASFAQGGQTRLQRSGLLNEAPAVRNGEPRVDSGPARAKFTAFEPRQALEQIPYVEDSW